MIGCLFQCRCHARNLIVQKHDANIISALRSVGGEPHAFRGFLALPAESHIVVGWNGPRDFLISISPPSRLVLSPSSFVRNNDWSRGPQDRSPRPIIISHEG